MARSSRFFSVMLWVGVSSGLGLACGGVGDLTVVGTGGASSGSSTGGSTGSSGATGVPCDVAAALTTCVACHSNPPIAGAVGSLVSFTDLTAVAPADPLRPPTAGATMAQMAVIRMQDTVRPMPPAGLPADTAAQIQAVQAWVTAGTQMGTCGADAGPPDTTFTGPSICNGTLAPFTGDGSSDMTPGEPCIACHGTTGGPNLAIGGTVFATGHVPNDCYPSTLISGAQVVITDNNNAVFTLNVDGAGNFSRRASSQPAVAFPIHAKVVWTVNGVAKERPMLTPQMSGDCNVCHTDKGTTNVPSAPSAPGRIALPI